MTKDPNLDQQLLDLIYGLLDEEQALALRGRIESQAEVAQAYAEARRAADVFSQAARLPALAIPLKRPPASEFVIETPAEVIEPADKPSALAAPWRRWADWTVAVAAGVLLVVSAAGFLSEGSRPVHLGGDLLRLQVTGPSVLRSGMENEYTVTTSTVFGSSVQGRAADVQFALYDSGNARLLHYAQPTDEEGRLRVSVPADLDLPNSVRLEVTVGGESGQESAIQSVDTRVAVEPAGFLTRLTLDKGAYRPGDTIFFRSLTLSRFALTPADSLPVHLEILDPAGEPLDGSTFQDVTQHGVGWGQCVLPADSPGGEYALLATSPDGQFARQRKTFSVRHQEPPRLAMELEFTRDSFDLGDMATADFAAHSRDGRPVGNASLAIQAVVEGQTVYSDPAAVASSEGAYRIRFPLPADIDRDTPRPNAQLLVTVDDGGPPETATRRIPINRGALSVDFFPEGGELTGMTQNRVYFTAVDPRGEPVHIEGAVLSGDVTVARVHTIHDGMGAFSFIPMPGQRYRLQIDSPAGVEMRPELPRIDPNRAIVLNTGTGVFAAGEPLEFNVRSARAGVPLVASAVCRGVPVGHQAFVAQEGANLVSLALPEEVSGVIRLTIHDYRESPPKPLAERLVFRRHAGGLDLNIQGQKEAYRPGDQVDLAVAVAANGLSNESAASAKSDAVDAFLGIAVVDRRGLLEANGNRAAGPTAYFLLGGEVRNPEDLDNADFYLADNRQAELALDLLLGTQGWRRFTEVSASQLVVDDENPDDARPDSRLVPLGEEPPPPAMFDNLAELRQQHEQRLEALQDDSARGPGTLSMIGFVGGIGLMLLVGMLSLLGISSGVRLWAPTFGVAAACVILGATRMAETVPETVSRAAVAFAQFDLSENVGRVDADDSTPDAAPVAALAVLAEASPALDEAQSVNEMFADSIAVDGAVAKKAAGRRPRDAPEEGGEPAFEAMAEPPIAVDGAEPSAMDLLAPPPALPSDLPAAAMRMHLPAESPAPDPVIQPAVVAPEVEEAEPAPEAVAEEEADEVIERPPRGRHAVPGHGGPSQRRGGSTEPRFFSEQAEFEAAPDEKGRAGSERERVVDLDRRDILARSPSQSDLGYETYYDQFAARQDDDVESVDELGGGFGGGGFGSGGSAGIGAYSAERPGQSDDEARRQKIERPTAAQTFMTREFRYPAASELRELRSDFTETVYWNPLAPTDSQGVARFDFRLVDSITTYRVLVEAHDERGRLAAAVGDLVTRRPLSLLPTLPAEVTVGDRIEVPLAVINTTQTPLDVELELVCDAGLAALEGTARQSLASIDPQGQGQVYFPLEVVDHRGTVSLQFSAAADQLSDRVERRLTIVPSGFPAVTSDAGWIEGPSELVVRLPDDRIPGSTVACLTVFPTPLSELRAGLASIDHPTQGAPEQVLAAISLNVLTQHYMSTADLADPGLTRRTRTSLGRLSALAAGESDDTRLARLAAIPDRPEPMAESLAGFIALDQADLDLIELSAGGLAKLRAQAQQAPKQTAESDDLYQDTLDAVTRLNRDQTSDARELLERLAESRAPDGSLDASLEATALAAMAWMQSGQFSQEAQEAVDWIVRARQSGGGFGSTRATASALAVLLEHDSGSPRTVRAGLLSVSRDGQIIAQQSFDAERQAAVQIDGLAEGWVTGDNRLSIELTSGNRMPYLLEVRYLASRPDNDNSCPLRLTTRLDRTQLTRGEPVQLTAELVNTTEAPLPPLVVILGLPAGLQIPFEELETTRDAGLIDSFQTRPREVILQRRGLAAGETLELSLHGVAAIPGRYTGPASRAYLHDSPRAKQWTDPLTVEISRE